MSYWEPAVFGPYPDKCSYFNSVAGSTSWAYDLYMDGNGDANDIADCCHGMVTTAAQPGRQWTGTLPGLPDACATSSVAPGVPDWFVSKPHALSLNEFETISNYYIQSLYKYLLVAAAVAAALLVTNLCLVGTMLRGRRRKTYSYSKAQVDSDGGL